jgi:protoheme IX farnesyltransferase
MFEAAKKYLLVAKPGIIFGNLITAAAGFLLASKGRIDIAVLLCCRPSSAYPWQ